MFDSKLFDTDYLSHSICRAKKYRNTVSLMGAAINQRQFDRASNPDLGSLRDDISGGLS